MHPVQFPFHTAALEMTVLSMSCFLRVISPGVLLFFTWFEKRLSFPVPRPGLYHSRHSVNIFYCWMQQQGSQMRKGSISLLTKNTAIRNDVDFYIANWQHLKKYHWKSERNHILFVGMQNVSGGSFYNKFGKS